MQLTGNNERHYQEKQLPIQRNAKNCSQQTNLLEERRASITNVR
jgi:hypothetical protein